MNKKLKRLLEKIQSDYDHPWPNEDNLTKRHRLKILKEITSYLFKIS